MSTPTAAWSARDLMVALRHAGWGEGLNASAQRGWRAVLGALVDMMPWGSAEGSATAVQVADVAGMSERHVRRCLHGLEALGLIAWRRGWLDRGRRRSGYIRINKRALAAHIRTAREGQPERRAKQRERRHAALGERIARLNRLTPTIRQHPQTVPVATRTPAVDNSRENTSKPDMASNPHPSGEVTAGPPPAVDTPEGEQPTGPPPANWMALARQLIKSGGRPLDGHPNRRGAST